MGTANEAIVLRAQLPLYPKEKPCYDITVLQHSIVFCPVVEQRGSKVNMDQLATDTKPKELATSRKLPGGAFTLLLDDIIGCDCMKGRAADDKSAYLTLYAYPHMKKFGSKKTLRRRQTFTLTFKSAPTYEENLSKAEIWKSSLLKLMNRCDLIVTGPLDGTENGFAPQKKLLILINPFSGQGNGKSLIIFKERVVPILAEAAIPYHMIVTDHAGHAYEMMHTLDLKLWSGLVIVSGDGLIYEVVNGLMQRDDYEEAIKFPIGCLPGGSGNALASALAHSVGEPYMENQLLHSAFMLAKHQLVPMDLVAIDTCTGKRLYSFLSVAWGMVSDVDIESERFRSMGNARFTLGVASKLLGLKKYRGRVSFLPVEPYTPRQKKKTPTAIQRSKSEIAAGQDTNASNLPRSKSMVENPGANNGRTSASESGDVQPDALSPQISVDESQLLPASGRAVDFTLDTSPADAAEGLDAQPLPTAREPMTASFPHQPATPLLVPLDQPVPEDWVTIDGEFLNVMAVYLTHLARDTIAAPDSCLDDGLIYFSMVRAGVTRMKMLQIFTSMQDGTFHGDEEAEVIKVKAFRIEPLCDPGIMTVDGEVVDFGPIQGQIMPSMSTVMSMKKKASSTH